MLLTITILALSQIQHNWNDVPNQYWIGSHWHANRLQDWQVDEGRVICTEVSERLPMRTLHLLTAYLDGEFTLEVTTGTINTDLPSSENAWSGVLIGAGNIDIDHRLTALTHHVPATDGGYIAGVDHNGEVFLRKNVFPVGGTSLWSINTKISPDDLPLVEPIRRRGDGFGKKGRRPVRLKLNSALDQGTHGFLPSFRMEAIDIGTNEILSYALYDFSYYFPHHGSFALVSHHGPEGATAGHWFDDFSLKGNGVLLYPERAFGPVLCSLYTLSDNVLKMTAQFPPLDHRRNAVLAFADHKVLTPIDTDSWTATFRIPNWNATTETPYELFLEGNPAGYKGTIRQEPDPNKPLKIAALTCHKTYTGNLQWNHDGLWFPHNDIVAAVEANDPDLLYFSGDQIYEGDLTPAWQKSEDEYIIDYLYKWTHWCWAFGDLTRDRPCITIPDDHDVYHGNLWGAGERDAQKVEGLTRQDSGGYKHGPRFVNAVHRTQTSHLPDPVDASPDAQGNSVYFTRLRYGGLDIAILADRQFKESPAIAVPEGGVYNGWFKADGFDPATQSDKPVPLLGKRQEAFLHEWSTDWMGDDWMKAVFSQTPFICLQTLPDGTFGGHQAGLQIHPIGQVAPDDTPAADADSNGWPQSGRNRALAMIKKANAIHVTGDQHLGYLARYGIEEHQDGTYVLCTPAIANTWPRRWMPKGKPITGDHLDGFGNMVTVLAVSNPHTYGHEPSALHDRAPGWSLLVCEPTTESILVEVWPRWASPDAPDSDQYDGWPITLQDIGRSGAAGESPN